MLTRLSGGTSDRGASAIFIAFTMVLLMGVAALVIDATGAGFNERRQDQTSVDVAAAAGGVEVLLGASGTGVSTDDMVAAALTSARANLTTDYDDAEWQQLWEECTDPGRNTEPGDNFVALDAPSSWSVVGPSDWCMSVDAAKSLFRVRVPDQIVRTTFGRIIGFSELRTNAAAVVNFEMAGGGLILPFGIPSGIADGVHHCLSEPPPGLSNDPCDMPDSGNFGVLKARIFGPSPYNGCNAAPTNPVLALNIAAGIDHIVVPAPDTSAANEVRDECYNFPVNTLQTDTGFPQGVENGMATGQGLPSGETALLQQGPQPKQNVVGNSLDNRPLWHWLLTSPSYDDIDAPATCNPSAISTWLDMGQCLSDYSNGGYDTVIFSAQLGDRTTANWSPRFGYAPQFHESSLGPGNTWRHVQRFRAIFVQGTWWKLGNNWKAHQPGEGCFDDSGASTPCTASGNWQLLQVTSWIIPDEALPSSLKGDPPGSATGINPFVLRLIR
jgi:hypothetical protein